jgi:prolyl 4-hydroxylase
MLGFDMYWTPAMADTQEQRGQLYWSVADVFDAAECAQFIAKIEALQPSVAPITTAHGSVVSTHTRNNDRVMFDDQALADTLALRLKAALPPTLCGRPLAGVNARFRGYRYAPGQAFKPHLDGSYQPSPTLSSELTLLLYLNEGFAGGETRFFLGDPTSITPQRGAALLFVHAVLHEGVELIRGQKYVLRSDIMYGK